MHRTHMPRRVRICVMLIILTGLACTRAWAITSTEVDALIARFGKSLLVDLILDRRAGLVTLALAQEHVQRYGRPNLNYVTSTTLAEDLAKAGLDSTAATAALESLLEKQQRLSTRQTHARPSALPLVGFDPNMRIRGDRRSWSIETLIKDAYKTRSNWPDWLNAIRLREAKTRNRAVEKLLWDMQAKYGSTDYNKAARFADQQHKAKVRACRSIPNRERNPEYLRNNCKDTLSQKRPSSSLRKELREPFIQFRKNMRPHIDRFLLERTPY